MGIVRLVSKPFPLTLSSLLLRSTNRSTRTRKMTRMTASSRPTTAPTIAPELPALSFVPESLVVGSEDSVGSGDPESVEVVVVVVGTGSVGGEVGVLLARGPE